jgi:hypothetical protein
MTVAVLVVLGLLVLDHCDCHCDIPGNIDIHSMLSSHILLHVKCVVNAKGFHHDYYQHHQMLHYPTAFEY